MINALTMGDAEVIWNAVICHSTRRRSNDDHLRSVAATKTAQASNEQ